MSTSLVLRVLWLRHRLRQRERWSQERLHDHQRAALTELRQFAAERSRFYARRHRGLAHAPLSELPVLTKSDLMANFDEIATDPHVRLAALEDYLNGTEAEPFHRRYWVAATSGSSGRRSIIPTDVREWATVIASYARANEWAGITAGLSHRTRLAVVSSTTAWHQSSRVAASVQSPFVLSERIDAAAPLDQVVARLNRVQPEALVGYASMIRSLAVEQLAGRLRISPRAVNSSSEVLTSEARSLSTQAWGVPPFNVYAATETGGIAAECREHSMHLFDDLVIPEVVDDTYRPVPVGETGSRLLVTVLSSRTIPLIRYEMTDRVQLSSRRCACGLPFPVLAEIEGRTDDILALPAPGRGTVQVHPVVFHQVLDLLDVVGWQVRADADGIIVLVAAPQDAVDGGAVEHGVRAALASAGATPQVRVELVDAIPPGPGGKRPLVVATRRPGSSSAALPADPS